MRKIIVAAACLFFISMKSAAQKNPVDNISLNDLYIPDVPGFVLSDKAPSSVDKPVTPRAFGISLLNLWQGGAVDVTPYWLTGKPSYTFDQWIDKKFTVAETFNISAATFKTDTSSILSAGFRTQLFRIYTKNQKAAMLQKKKEIVDSLAPDFDDNGELLPLKESTLIGIKKKLAEIEYLKTKDLFSVELAGALIGSSPNNSFKGLASSRSGVWLNLRWSPAKSLLDFTGVVRYSWANNAIAKTGKDSSFLDLGVALNYQKEKFNLSAEFVSRNDFSIKKNYDRFAFVANYVISENVIIVASIGKNFKAVDNIVSAFGVKFGLSRSNVSLSKKAEQ